jgi:hypothetical protein
MFFCLDKKCKSHLWKKTDESYISCAKGANQQQAWLMVWIWFWWGSIVGESSSRSILTRYESTHFSQNCIFFPIGHHIFSVDTIEPLFLNQISLEGPHQVSSKVALGLCSLQINETWKTTTLDVSKNSEYYIVAIWLDIRLIAKSLILNRKSGVRL